MNAQIDSVRSRHPAIVAASVIGGIAFIACALLVIAYTLDWLPAKPPLPNTAARTANPGPQGAGSAPDVALLPGETLVAPPETIPRAAAGPARPSPPVQPQPMQPAAPAAPAAPKYAKSPAQEPAQAPATPPAVYAQSAPPPSPPMTYTQPLPSRAAPSKPNYTRDELAARTPERSGEEVCVNCGAITSIASSGADWEVRVRFDDGSSETLRYPERPRLRTGDRVHLEDGRLTRD